MDYFVLMDKEFLQIILAQKEKGHKEKQSQQYETMFLSLYYQGKKMQLDIFMSWQNPGRPIPLLKNITKLKCK